MRGWTLAVTLILPQVAVAQDVAFFEAGLGECARYITEQPQAEWNFQTPPATLDTDEGGIEATVVYPQGSAGNFDFAVGYSYSRGTSTTPGTWTCSGTGPKAPQWAQFAATGWIGVDARLRANGLVELNFPPPQRAYANCTAAAPDVYFLFNAGAGDRVVFVTTTGPTAAAFCSSMGWKG